MTTGETTREDGRGERSRRRRRRRRSHHQQPQVLARTDRMIEMLLVATVSLVVLGAGITWIATVAYRAPADSEANVNLSSPDDSLAAQNPNQPAVVIIQDNSAKPDPAPADKQP